MNVVSHRVRFAAACLLLALGACGGGGDGDSSGSTQPAGMVRWWSFNKFHDGAVGEVRLGDERAQVGGAVHETVEFGPMVLFPHLSGPNAKADVFSSDTGATYWVFAQAPSAVLGTGAAIGNSVQLTQYQYFRKTTANATLRIIVSKAFMEAIDENGGNPTALECPWHRPGATYFDCHRVMTAWVDFDVTAYSFFDQTTLLKTGGFAELLGWQDNWFQDAYTRGDATTPFWNNASFRFEPDVEGGGGGHSVLYLPSPITIDVPLSSVPVGELFYLYVSAKASTFNHRQRESYLSAYFRDPQQLNGLQFSFDGVEPVDTPTEKPVATVPAPAPACTTGPDPQAGALQFDAATYEDPELPGDGATIIVTRSGGSRGAVSVKLATSDGNAVAGTHYMPVTTQVMFDDGEMGPRAVRIPIIVDAVAESDRTVNLTLSAPGGCATLGAQSSAVLTILDDDRPPSAPPPPPSGLDPTFGNAGKATSTESNGNSLSAFGGDRSSMALQADGKIVMVGGTFTDFILARFNADGSLDGSFGVDGKVSTDMGSGFLPEEATGVAIQPDGKIIVVGYTAIPATPPAPSLPPTFALARYDTHGVLDTSFGSGGRVSGNVNGRAYAVAIQGDAKIVVAGDVSFASTNGLNFSDFVVARFNANGNLDTSFGDGVTGQVVTDLGLGANGARNLVLQPDGAIVVSGKPQGNSAGFDHTDMVRYQPDGRLDTSFGNGGKLTLAGVLVGEGLALQRDGMFVLAGSATVGTPSAPSTRFALMRLKADGSADTSFGNAGVVNTAFTVNAAAAGVALQPDGKIVAVGTTVLAANPNFVVARYNTDGSVDSGFGSDGNLSIDFFGFSDVGENVLLQPDGKIVVGGQARNNFGGYGLARINP